jgi:hypothetical protein
MKKNPAEVAGKPGNPKHTLTTGAARTRRIPWAEAAAATEATSRYRSG